MPLVFWRNITSGRSLPASDVNPIPVGGTTPRVVASFTRPADATQYTAGDHIANHGTGASVVPMKFVASQRPSGSGRIIGARCVVTPGSGNLVITNLAFDLLLFRPVANIPFAAGSFPADNAALAISAAAMRHLVSVISFGLTGWRNPAGSTLSGGVAGWQAAKIVSDRSYATFDLGDLTGADNNKLIGVLQARSTWDPGAVAQQFDFDIDIEGN